MEYKSRKERIYEKVENFLSHESDHSLTIPCVYESELRYVKKNFPQVKFEEIQEHTSRKGAYKVTLVKPE